MKWRVSFIIGLASLILTVTAMAADGGAAFVNKCGACHVKGGAALPVNPADKAAVVWGKYFKRGRHRVDFSQNISVSDLETIVTYLKKHAADSDQPEAAAIPK